MPIKKPLTRKQERVLAFLRDFFYQQGYPPTVREIARYLGMSGPHSAKRFLDMLEQKGYIRRLARRSRAIELIDTPSIPPPRMVPLVGRVRAGVPLLAEENIEGTIALDRSLARWDTVFLLRVVGESMIEAHITDGDLALVKPQPTIYNGEIAVVLIQDEATIKRFFKQDNTIRLEPANPSMQPLIIKPGEQEVKILGKVVAILRDIEGKTVLHKKVSAAMKIGDSITVAVVFGGKQKIRPVWFIWDGREYRIKQITYIWNRREGRSLLYYFAVTDTADNFYEICYRTDSITWYLLTVEGAS